MMDAVIFSISIFYPIILKLRVVAIQENKHNHVWTNDYWDNKASSDKFVTVKSSWVVVWLKLGHKQTISNKLTTFKSFVKYLLDFGSCVYGNFNFLIRIANIIPNNHIVLAPPLVIAWTPHRQIPQFIEKANTSSIQMINISVIFVIVDI